MHNLFSLFKKPSRRVLGILSGTSVDAVDIVLTEISGAGGKTKLQVVDFNSYPIDAKLKAQIISLASNKSCTIEEVCSLNFIIGRLFADCVLNFCKSGNIDGKDIDLIGSHGQTVWHQPEPGRFNTCSTLQIGESSVIANVTGITTISDFRTADIAAGGKGAPLIPYLDFILFNEKNKNKVLLNIGGIANVTFLTGDGNLNNVKGFDTGPGNMLIDAAMKKLFDKPYDKFGETAFSGVVDEELLYKIMETDSYYNQSPPKCTGREYYGDEFLDKIMELADGHNSNDVIAAISTFTLRTISYNIKTFFNDKIDEIVVNGGGSKNHFIMSGLKNEFPDANVNILNQDGITSENKEAVLFAVLANELVCGNKPDLTTVTGSQRPVFLGKICIA